MCEAIKDYKQLDSQHELKTTTLNQNWTQQNKNNSDELKTGLDEMEMTLMRTIIKMKSVLSWTIAKWCTHVDWTKSLTQNIPKYHMTINTINIQINLLKTRRRRNYMCRMCRQGIGSHTWPRQVDQPWINQVLYRMMEHRTMLSIMPLNLMI